MVSLQFEVDSDMDFPIGVPGFLAQPAGPKALLLVRSCSYLSLHGPLLDASCSNSVRPIFCVYSGCSDDALAIIVK